MRLQLYPLLSTRSKRAISKTGKRKYWTGYKYKVYVPRKTLIERLAQQTGMSEDEVILRIDAEVNYIQSLRSQGSSN